MQAKDAEAVEAGTRVRRRRTELQQELRDLYLEEAPPGGAPTIQDVIRGDISVERFTAESNPAEQFARRVFEKVGGDELVEEEFSCSQ